MIKTILKKCWKIYPQTVRSLFADGLCLIGASIRDGNAPEKDPTYVCGSFYTTSGLAQSARLYVDKLESEGKQVLPIDITDAMLQKHTFQPVHAPMSMSQARPMLGEGRVVIHANPPHFQLSICKLGKAFLRHKRVIGFWAWELEAIPDIWRQALRYVDEVQTPSSFVQNIVQRYTQKTVKLVPHEVPAPPRVKEVWARDGVVRCLYIFDAASSYERKNPLAALHAFQKAFAPGQAELLFKVSNPAAGNRWFMDFQKTCAAVPGVRLLTTSLSQAEMNELYLRHDIYLSLHRSEGYGLTIREAMLHGLHVVATGWSGNMDFMAGDRCHAVPYRLVPVNLNYGPCKGLKARWADADVDAAADILRSVGHVLNGGGHA